jgi:alkylation response protein AidB-like acyl-CoA dehydrogenase
MANFFTDNPDLVFLLQTADLAPIVRLWEGDFAEADRYDYAPADVDDAIDSYRRVLEMIGELAGEHIAPRAEQIDRTGNTLEDGRVTYAPGMQENLDLLAKAEVMGMTLPRRFGGLNFPAFIYTIATEIISRADASVMNLFGLQGIAETIHFFADDDIQQRFLPDLVNGKLTGAMALTEPDAGSDLQAVQLKAEQDGDGRWFLSGVKRFITNGCGDVLLVLVRSEPGTTDGLGLSCFVCRRCPQLRVRRIEDKLGIHGSPTCELQFDRVPAELIGERRRGLITYVMQLMNGARLGIAAQSVGIAQAALVEARKYAAAREQFRRRIDQMPPVADMLVSMSVKTQAARALTLECAYVVDLAVGAQRAVRAGDKTKRKEAKQLDRLAGFLTPIGKYYASEICNQVTFDAISVLGGSGFMRDYPLERHFRDARITNIYEGTSQMQIVAAIRGVTSGIAERYFGQLADAGAGARRPELAERLADHRRLLGECIEKYKASSVAYQDLVARHLVDIATDILVGYLFCRQAAFGDDKLTLARRWIAESTPRVHMRHERVTSGEASTLEAFETLAGPLPAED